MEKWRLNRVWELDFSGYRLNPPYFHEGTKPRIQEQSSIHIHEMSENATIWPKMTFERACS
jgi:hypothetical protein